MLTGLVIRGITAEETYRLRHSILHPDRPRAFSAYAGDHCATTWHAGAFLRHEHIGVASIYLEVLPGQENSGAWRLRDMGVVAPRRRHGCGKALLDACLAQVVSRGGRILWCYARPTAVPFYLAQRFQVRGDAIDLPDFGPRYILWRRVEPELVSRAGSALLENHARSMPMGSS